MKKYNITLALVLSFSLIRSIGYTDTVVDWKRGSSGGIRTESSSPTPIGLNSIWVLYYSPSANYGALNSNGNLMSVGGDSEILLVANNESQLGILNASDLPSLNTIQEFGSGLGDYVGGSFYTRVFNYQDASIISSNPSTWNINFAPGTYYYHQTPMFGPSSESFNTTPTILEVFWNDDGINNAIGLAQTNLDYIVVPEPGTIALMLIAGVAVVVGVRRKRS